MVWKQLTPDLQLQKAFGYTPPKFNIEPKNEGLEDVFPFQMSDFQVPY